MPVFITHAGDRGHSCLITQIDLCFIRSYTKQQTMKNLTNKVAPFFRFGYQSHLASSYIETFVIIKMLLTKIIFSLAGRQ